MTSTTIRMDVYRCPICAGEHIDAVFSPVPSPPGALWHTHAGRCPTTGSVIRCTVKLEPAYLPSATPTTTKRTP